MYYVLSLWIVWRDLELPFQSGVHSALNCKYQLTADTDADTARSGPGRLIA